jgi:iron complex transport system ATP-binding protein
MSRLTARALAVRRGSHTLIRNLDVEFCAGENWAILGANGSGKTTLLLTLAGLYAPETGEAQLDGQAIQSVPRRQRAQTLGVLFQHSESAFPSTVQELVLTGRHPHLGRWQEESADDLERVRAALAAVGLQDFSSRPLATLSGGEQRRAAFAALLAQDSPVCLLDEPANHLDPHHQLALLSLAAARAARPGHLNLFVLHDVNLAARFCTHALLLKADGTHAHGCITDMLTTDNLGAVYGCVLRELTSDRQKFFFPA